MGIHATATDVAARTGQSVDDVKRFMREQNSAIMAHTSKGVMVEEAVIACLKAAGVVQKPKPAAAPVLERKTIDIPPPAEPAKKVEPAKAEPMTMAKAATIHQGGPPLPAEAPKVEAPKAAAPNVVKAETKTESKKDGGKGEKPKK